MWLVLMFVFFLYICMGVIGRWVISPFFLSINVSMAGVLYTMVSCVRGVCVKFTKVYRNLKQKCVRLLVVIYKHVI